MTNDLYFLSILAAELGPKAPAHALGGALAEIERRGRLPGHARGYSQYLRFMAHAVKCRKELTLGHFDYPIDLDLIAALLADQLDGEADALSLVNANPRWRLVFEGLRETYEAASHAPRPSLLLCKSEIPLLRAAIESSSADYAVEGVMPGCYTLLLDNGQVLWHQDLTERELLWRYAFPDRPLGLAADAGPSTDTAESSLEVLLADGIVLLRVHPGIESGRIGLRIQGVNGGNCNED
jgi:hypothetical protein